jgi:hypothetical protein
MSADRALAAAIRAAALADAGVKAVLGDPARFYDDPPPDAAFPYATLGRIECRPLDTSETHTLEHAVTLHVWSRHGGRAEALDAIAALRACLHDAQLAVSGRNLVLLLVTASDVFRSGDGRTTQGVLRLRAITEDI